MNKILRILTTAACCAFGISLIVTTSVIAARLKEDKSSSISFDMPTNVTINTTQSVSFNISNFNPGNTTHTVDDVTFFVVNGNYEKQTGFSFSGTGCQRTIQHSSDFSSAETLKLVSQINDAQSGNRIFGSSKLLMTPTQRHYSLYTTNVTRSWSTTYSSTIQFQLSNGTYNPTNWKWNNDYVPHFLDTDHTTDIGRYFSWNVSDSNYMYLYNSGTNPWSYSHTCYIDFVSSTQQPKATTTITQNV